MFKTRSFFRTNSIRNVTTIVNSCKKPTSEPSVLEPCDPKEVAHVAPYLRPSFNLAAYVNKSQTLQELLKLHVNLYKVEKQKDAGQLILSLDFKQQVQPLVIFLHDLGVSVEDIGNVITRNPYIFKVNLDDMAVRVNYLQYKKFTKENIVRILSKNPYWLMYSTHEIDDKLGFFQNQFKLSGKEVRMVTVHQPKLITFDMKALKSNYFSIKEEMCFDDDQCKQILLKKPNIYMKRKENLMDVFEYLHNEMNIPLSMIAEMPDVLTSRLFRLKSRYLFLKTLGKIQFDPRKPGYISPLTIVQGDDSAFCIEVAKCPLEHFNIFLKTL